ncbi:hypothetical protein [Dyadobacter sp. NIV53]|uniref:hypothetical protein n=1 Tax=Dyadobacter sp. NIV53 TaxID=2861765 RepID=UPI001C879E66|nr:hypothetical protein [Dyadobacter sp. NIV53]
MKNVNLLFVLLMLTANVMVFIYSYKNPSSIITSWPEQITICGSNQGNQIVPADNGKFIVPLPGWGEYSYRIATKQDSAQFYFDQGLNMYYGYHLKEALASFKEASRFDPNAIMAYWGQALAMGPYYNGAHTYVMPTEIQAVLKRMNEISTDPDQKEIQLIKAMNLRYSLDASDSKRKELNLAYASAMRELVKKYPDDHDIKALYVDAVMLIHPWDFWNNDGSPKSWTNEVVDLSEGILRKNPDHPGALHYHIHLTEASRHPEVALNNADKLKTLLPGIPHMVHMSSHEYQRNGLYAKGVEVNDLADENLLRYNVLAKNLNLNKHSPHYFAVQTYCAMSGAMYKTGMQNALRCRNSVSPTYENTYDQYLYMLPVLTLVRLGKWEEILRDSTSLDSRWHYAGLIHHFAKGMAYVNMNEIASAQKQLTELQNKAKDPILKKRRIPFNTPSQIAGIAEGILNAAILFSHKENDKAISSLMNAIEIEDKLIYTEPNDWPISARQFFGAYLLKIGKPAIAEMVYREDLLRNPGNGWTLLGLCQSLEAQYKTKQLAEFKAKYLVSFSHADELPTGSVYLR